MRALLKENVIEGTEHLLMQLDKEDLDAKLLWCEYWLANNDLK